MQASSLVKATGSDANVPWSTRFAKSQHVSRGEAGGQDAQAAVRARAEESFQRFELLGGPHRGGVRCFVDSSDLSLFGIGSI